ncbi:tRNA (guanine-N1)-methyltransferase [Spirulina sp. CS-785/01]|uniref:tRNA (guanine-N1)-methyltransferase n=1 Tax=Spirulina sp. CS-785/01 TaxID=3021716 RepID=UPI00232B1BC8|nr:tRNA (guanine-N1)-methyltransferase [Spirulina sp. CS-785/01]MDB9314777.1 tRNA (guanine-N1)-methyltransferase [Spirulina sp. CS-785/01]
MTQTYSEGGATFQVGEAFFRSESRIVRDLGILAATVYRQEKGELRVLEGMAGCGVRSLRYLAESKADWVWVNEGNPDLIPLLQSNFKTVIFAQHAQLSCENTQRLLYHCSLSQDYYDFIDVDCFGNVSEFLASTLQAVKTGGLVYLTSTDGRSLTGHLPETSLARYGAYARSHPSHHEQALRILLGSWQQTAASLGWGIEPIFAFYHGETYRILVRLVTQSQLTPDHYGFLGYCHACGEYQQVGWRKLGQTQCHCNQRPLTITGPMWLGQLHDGTFLHEMQTLAQQWQWTHCSQLLEVMAQEAEFPPYFYSLGEIGRRGTLDIPPKAELIAKLRSQGYQATATHINPQAIKTDASLADCIQCSLQLKE